MANIGSRHRLRQRAKQLSDEEERVLELRQICGALEKWALAFEVAALDSRSMPACSSSFSPAMHTASTQHVAKCLPEIYHL